MKRVLLATLGFFALASGSALAADMGLPAKAPPLPPPSWTGCYVNAGGGYGMWNQDHSTTYEGSTTIDNTGGGNGWLGRFGGGCDYQFAISGLGNFVVGAFGDYDVMDLKGSMSPLELDSVYPILTNNEKEQGAWYAGGRIGYLITPSVLTYFSGGWTQTRFDSIAFTNVFGVPVDRMIPAHTYQGWFLGGGYEYALNFSWLPITGLFWRTEYLYSDYRKDDLPEYYISTGAPFGSVVHADKQVQTVTSSLVWRFNFGAPVMARY